MAENKKRAKDPKKAEAKRVAKEPKIQERGRMEGQWGSYLEWYGDYYECHDEF